MNSKKVFGLIIFLSLPCCLYAAGFNMGNAEKRAEKIDKEIVKAYNAQPKKTELIYNYSVELIECCSSSNVENGKEWIAKARRVITLACANEASIAIENKDYKKAYMWVNRGLEKGASDGSEAGYDVDKLYKYLLETKKNLEEHFDEYNIQYNKPAYSYTTSSNKHLNNKLFNKR